MNSLAEMEQKLIIFYSALVQLVRMFACHAKGQGFKSPTHCKIKSPYRILLSYLPGSEIGYNIMKKAIPNAFVNEIEGLGVNPLVLTIKK